MEQKNTPPADEKTKVIQVNKPADTPSPNTRPAVKPAANEAARPSPFASYFKNGNSKAKRTILAGAVGGGLIISMLALSSFTKKPGDDETTGDTTTGTGDGNSNSNNNTTPIQEGDIVQINTGHEVYTGLNDDLSLDEARLKARENVGEEGLFVYKDELHPAMTDEEWNSLTDEEKLAYIDNINVTTPADDEVITVPVEVNGEIINLKMDPLHRTDLVQLGTDDSGHVFLVPQGRPGLAMENLSPGENGTYYRTDPETNELSVFTIEELFKQINDTGKAEVEVLVPGIEEPVIDGVFMYGYIDNAYSDSYISSGNNGETGTYMESPVTGYGWGWDTDGDDDIDIYDDDFTVTDEPDPYLMPEYYNTITPEEPVIDTSSTEVVVETAPQKTDEELLHERVLLLAKEGGIEDISKIKTHRNDDGSWDIKIKGDDGEKIKTTITIDDLHQSSVTPADTDTTNDPAVVVDPVFIADADNTDTGTGSSFSSDGEAVTPDDTVVLPGEELVSPTPIAIIEDDTVVPDGDNSDYVVSDLTLNIDDGGSGFLTPDPNDPTQNDITQP